ncbi:hypothetical protein DFH08DRAFT_817053 [Mycena albidolilacea]|uniref:Uncharacterized protein n=1 Tax=Mycena albidolilacea TaxID=1033008 RepID=A0AAD7EHH7_9AGAR|nr:hypothetical protein DFH08DRAFT_817053 [Mycena albidolilacea]
MSPRVAFQREGHILSSDCVEKWPPYVRKVYHAVSLHESVGEFGGGELLKRSQIEEPLLDHGADAAPGEGHCGGMTRTPCIGGIIVTYGDSIPPVPSTAKFVPSPRAIAGDNPDSDPIAQNENPAELVPTCTNKRACPTPKQLVFIVDMVFLVEARVLWLWTFFGS